MTIEGLEVLLLQPDFASPPKIVGNQKSDKTDLGQARQIHAYIGDHPLHSFTHRFVFQTRAEAEILEDFIFDRAGRWQPFWIPSWHGELNPVAAVLAGSDEISISPVNFATVFDPTHTNKARLGHYIFVIHRNGTIAVRQVLSVIGTSPEVLKLNEPLSESFDFALGEFAIGFLYCVTLITDKIAWQFSGIENVQVELAVTEESSIDEAPPESSEPTIQDVLVANFTASIESGDPPLDVDFTDTTQGIPVSWLWNFGDGSATSTAQNPSHTFSDSGNYAVRLQVRDANGQTSVITRTIVVNAEPVTPPVELTADFTMTPASGDAALEVAFTDDSLGTPTVWTWNFGDGFVSDLQSPSHTFAYPGTYTVTLDVRDTNGNTSRKVDSITVTEAASVPVTCDSGANYDDPGGYFVGTSCSPCCTELDAMAIDDVKPWTQIALLNCLGVTAGDGVTFEFNSKTFGVAYDPALNTDGSMNAAGNVFYDVVRIA